MAPDGLTYTFKLHPGVKFTNGREVVAGDVKYSIERAANPKTQGPGAGFFHSIVGADKMADGSAQTMPGIEVVDDRTIRFRLAQPDATFLNVLALDFASAVPKEAVEAANGDFGKHPVGSGAFLLKDWTIGQHLTFARNPDYFKSRPNLDGFTVEIGQEPLVNILRLQKGEVDIAGRRHPAGRIPEDAERPRHGRARSSTAASSRRATSRSTPRLKPFDDLRVRQALNMAINKERIIRIINGRATPATQVLPPLMPGYDKDYAGYPYDVAKAKALLKEAGVPDGFATTLYAMNADPNPRIAQAIQQDLAAVGIKAEIKAEAQAQVIEAGGTKATAPLVWSGGMGWIADFPDPSDFYGPILGCGGATQGGWNWTWLCDKGYEAKARFQGRRHVGAGAEGTRDTEAWRGIFTEIMQKSAPWVPVFNERRVVAKSKRMGGRGRGLHRARPQVIDYPSIFIKG